MSRDLVHETLRNPCEVGIMIFTYSVGELDGATTRYSTWFPPHGFQTKSLAELLNEIPGGDGASGLKLVFSGPGFSIGGQAFDEKDFARLHFEFNDQSIGSFWDEIFGHSPAATMSTSRFLSSAKDGSQTVGYFHSHHRTPTYSLRRIYDLLSVANLPLIVLVEQSDFSILRP